MSTHHVSPDLVSPADLVLGADALTFQVDAWLADVGQFVEGMVALHEATATSGKTKHERATARRYVAALAPARERCQEALARSQECRDAFRRLVRAFELSSHPLPGGSPTSLEPDR